jgi:hypothetical protein
MTNFWTDEEVRLAKAVDDAKKARDSAQTHLRNCTNDLAALEYQHQSALRQLRIEDAH